MPIQNPVIAAANTLLANVPSLSFKPFGTQVASIQVMASQIGAMSALPASLPLLSRAQISAAVGSPLQGQTLYAVQQDVLALYTGYLTSLSVPMSVPSGPFASPTPQFIQFYNTLYLQVNQTTPNTLYGMIQRLMPPGAAGPINFAQAMLLPYMLLATALLAHLTLLKIGIDAAWNSPTAMNTTSPSTLLGWLQAAPLPSGTPAKGWLNYATQVAGNLATGITTRQSQVTGGTAHTWKAGNLMLFVQYFLAYAADNGQPIPGFTPSASLPGLSNPNPNYPGDSSYTTAKQVNPNAIYSLQGTTYTFNALSWFHMSQPDNSGIVTQVTAASQLYKTAMAQYIYLNSFHPADVPPVAAALQQVVAKLQAL